MSNVQLYIFFSITLYNKHQIFYKNMPDLRIICFFKNCGKQFNKYFNFKKHILRWHTMDNKTCKRNITFNCKERNGNVCFTSRTDFNRHLYDHITESKIGIYCGYLGCSTNTIFKIVNTYAVHICRYHSSLYEQRIGNNNHRELDFDTNDYNFCLNEESLSQVSNNAGNLIQISDAVHYVKAVSQLYLNLFTKYFLTERGLQAVIDSISSVTELHWQYFIDTLTESDLQDDVKEKIKNMFQNSYSFFNNVYNSANGCLRNTYSRNKYFKENFNIVMLK